MENEKIYIREFIQMLLRHKKSLFIIMTLSLLCFIQLSFILPKSFKSDFELNIYSKYFYNALISDLVPGVNTTPEMAQTIDAMVKEVLNDDFIDELGKNFKIYPNQLNKFELSKRRQLLREQFELFPNGGTSYHIGFIHSDPEIAFEVSKKVLERVREHFINTRIGAIELAQQTILKKLESANVTKQFSDNGEAVGGSNALASKNPTVLYAEIAKINQDINSLKLQFNSNHPSIIKLEQRKATLEGWLNEVSQNKVGAKEDYKDSKYSPVLMSNDKETSKNITSRLYTNFNNINIALDIERRSIAGYIAVTVAPQFPTAPLFPKKRLFASLGLVVGLAFCFIYVLYKEIMNTGPVAKAQEVADKFNGNFFGTLPVIDEDTLMSNRPLLLEDKTHKYKLEYKQISEQES